MNAHALQLPQLVGTAVTPASLTPATPVGTLAYTQDAWDFLRDHPQAWLHHLGRYRRGDWGHVSHGEARLNDSILSQSTPGSTTNRIFGRYTVGGRTITIATDQLDGDAPYTTIYLGEPT